MLNRTVIRQILFLQILFFNVNSFAQDQPKTLSIGEDRALAYFVKYGVMQGNFPIHKKILFEGYSEANISYYDDNFCDSNIPWLTDSISKEFKKNRLASGEERLVLNDFIGKGYIVRRGKRFSKNKYYKMRVFRTNYVANYEYTKIILNSEYRSIVFHIFYDRENDFFSTTYSGAIF